MADKKSKRLKDVSGKIHLLSDIDMSIAATRLYKGRYQRNGIIKKWEKMYNLNRKGYYTIQIVPDVSIN